MPTSKKAARFKWDDDKDEQLKARWLDTGAEKLMALFGCSRSTLFARARDLNLGPRQHAARAIWQGEKPHDRSVITLAPFRFPPDDDDATADEPAHRHAGGSRAALAAAGNLRGRFA